MEIWDLYTADRKPTGKTMIRGEKIPDGYYHLGVQVWIKNSEGKYLISQRAASRKNYPLYWETVGGAVVSGENTFEAALREVKEEVGIDLDPMKVHFLFTRHRTKIGDKLYNDFGDIYLAEFDGELDLATAKSEEVEQSRWMSKEDIRKLLENGKLVESLAYFFEEIECD